jgi:prepilin-type N-terminal cleavage/methylation domain-containing protein
VLITSKRYTGFTLAEVLITLSIIGVVAALTIPGLMHNFETTQQKVAWKKAFSMASQAGLTLAANNSGSLVGVYNSGNNATNVQAVMTAIEGTMGGYVKTCSGCAPATANCFPDHLTIGGSSSYGSCTGVNGFNFNGSSAVLKNGMSINVSYPAPLCDQDSDGTCFWIEVDINGMKGPNIIGKDMFFLTVNKNGVARAYGWNLSAATLNSDCSAGAGHIGSTCSALYLQQ